MKSSTLLFLISLSINAHCMEIWSPGTLLKKYAPDIYLDYWPWAPVANEHEIYQAVEDSDHNYLKALLQKKVDPNFFHHQTNISPLSNAVEKDDVTAINILLDHNANSTFAYSNETPLVRAFKKDNLYIAGLLLSKNQNLAKNILSLIATIKTEFPNTDHQEYIFNHIGAQDLTQTIDNISNISKQITFAKTHAKINQQIWRYAIKGKYTTRRLTSELIYENNLLSTAKLSDTDMEYLLERHEDDLGYFFTLFLQTKRTMPQSLLLLLEKYNMRLKPLHDTIKESLKSYSRLKEEYNQNSQQEIMKRSIDDSEIISSSDLSLYTKRDTLNETIKKLRGKISNLKSYCSHNTTRCPVCYDDYNEKSYVILCDNNHSVCTTCFNHPTMQNCPLCRTKCRIDKLDQCQSCPSKTNLKTSYCQKCEGCIISCDNCDLYPCCKEKKSENDQTNKIIEWATTWFTEIEQKKEFELQELQKKFYTTQEELQQQLIPTKDTIELLQKEYTQIIKQNTYRTSDGGSKIIFSELEKFNYIKKLEIKINNLCNKYKNIITTYNQNIAKFKNNQETIINNSWFNRDRIRNLLPLNTHFPKSNEMFHLMAFFVHILEDMDGNNSDEE